MGEGSQPLPARNLRAKIALDNAVICSPRGVREAHDTPSELLSRREL